MRAVEALQKDVWGSDDLDVVPATLLLASREVGAVLLGAFDGPTLAGFVYGFPGFENGEMTHHSHMLAVADAYRNANVGYRLKLAQRAEVLAQGIRKITWTFDPLQSLNAHFNFTKLGVFADKYKINFYGESTSSFLHQVGTDRLWITWPLDSERVLRRLQKAVPQSNAESVLCVLRVDSANMPQRSTRSLSASHAAISIEIPHDFNSLQLEQPALALEWRLATREVFTEAFAAGYVAQEFSRSTRKDHQTGTYILRPWSSTQF